MSDRDDFRRAVSSVSDPDPYGVIWQAEVIAQNEDGSLDLAIGEGPFVGDHLRVQFEPGLDCNMTIPTGALVRVAFLGGSPDGMFAWGRVFDQGAARPVARKNDPVDLGYLTATAPPGGGPCTLALSSILVPNSVHLTGEITDGSAVLRIP